MNRFAPLFVIIAASLWGVDSILLRPHLYTLPVPFVVFLESIIVAFLLTPILFKRYYDLKNLRMKDILAFLGVAFFGGALGTMAITKALFYVEYINLSVVVLMQKLQPVFALILASLLLKEKLPKEFFKWATLSIIGAFLMTFGLNLPNLNSGDYTIGAALYALLAAFSFGFSTVLSKRALKNVTYELGTYLRFVTTSIIMFVVILLIGEFSAVREVSELQWIIFGIIAFTSGGFAIFLYYYGLKRISASVATIAELSFPLTAILLEYFIHDNMLDWLQWIGTIILIYAIIRVSKLNFSKE
ncbi:MAG: EamA family transporter [Bacteroidetes bacterium]|nr:EamA family transporter [Bacteroidota bacterium]MBU1115496.1 EamA family transporter [Bacteroidota bacterium]MBU1798173.1 EamA family transporter [Bacteroidota bacterium]